MTQFDPGTIDPATKSGVALASDLNQWKPALHSLHKGPDRPAYVLPGMAWVKEISASQWKLMLHGSGVDVEIGAIDPTTGMWDLSARGGSFSAIPQLPAADPDSDNDAARKAYVDARDDERLALAGGTMAGMIVLPSTTPTDINHATRKGYVDAVAPAAKITVASSGWSGVYDLLNGVDTTFFDMLLPDNISSVIGSGYVTGYQNGGSDVQGNFAVQLLNASLAVQATQVFSFISASSQHSPTGNMYWATGGRFAFASITSGNAGWRLRFVAQKNQPQGPFVLADWGASALYVVR